MFLEYRQAWNIKTAKSWLFTQSELVLQLSSHNRKIKWYGDFLSYRSLYARALNTLTDKISQLAKSKLVT
nr:hypothetical protein CFP56_25482 [Quercus suber]